MLLQGIHWKAEDSGISLQILKDHESLNGLIYTAQLFNIFEGEMLSKSIHVHHTRFKQKHKKQNNKTLTTWSNTLSKKEDYAQPRGSKEKTNWATITETQSMIKNTKRKS